MALIKCPECGKEISDKAGACPHCGCPIGNATQPIQNNDGKSNKGSKKILIGVVAVVAIAGTGYYFGIAKLYMKKHRILLMRESMIKQLRN